MNQYTKKPSKNFHDDVMSEEGSHCICLSLTLTDSIFKIGKKYYSQVFLEECKYTIKGKKYFIH